MSKPTMKQLSKEQAIAFFNSNIWEDWGKKDIARFQLFQNLLCVPFDIYHQAIENLLGRPVWTHEFADIERLRNEYLTLASPPTLEEIMAMIPKEKVIAIILEED